MMYQWLDMEESKKQQSQWLEVTRDIKNTWKGAICAKR